MNHKRIPAIAVLLCLLVGIAACSHSPFTYVGRTVKEENRIPIQDKGSHSGKWKTDDLLLTYEYARDSDTVEISGTVTFMQHLENNFALLSNFSLQVHFVDPEGTILARGISLASAGLKYPMQSLPFREKLQLPAGTTAMVFSYRGAAEDTGSGEGRIDTEFWEIPTR